MNCERIIENVFLVNNGSIRKFKRIDLMIYIPELLNYSYAVTVISDKKKQVFSILGYCNVVRGYTVPE